MAKRRPAFTIGVLFDPQETEPPSGLTTIRYFQGRAAVQGVALRIGSYKELSNLNYDALFIRQGTAIGNEAHLLSLAAARHNIPVIDDPTSIELSCNKIAMMHRFRRFGIPTPASIAMSVHLGINAIKNKIEPFGYPIVLKDPNLSFSRGVYKVENDTELESTLLRLGTAGAGMFQVQEFMPTRFDWRVGVLGRRAVYCCQYNMAPGHWQVIKNNPDGTYTDGGSITLPPKFWPSHICALAVQAANTIGQGLYGVDIKERDGRAYVIEVNDNPTLDHGDEDKYGLVWERLIEHFRHLLNEKPKTSKINSIIRAPHGNIEWAAH